MGQPRVRRFAGSPARRRAGPLPANTGPGPGRAERAERARQYDDAAPPLVIIFSKLVPAQVFTFVCRRPLLARANLFGRPIWLFLSGARARAHDHKGNAAGQRRPAFIKK